MNYIVDFRVYVNVDKNNNIDLEKEAAVVSAIKKLTENTDSLEDYCHDVQKVNY